MKIILIDEHEITDYEKVIGSELIIQERKHYGKDLERFYCHFEHCEEMTGGCLISHCGNGNTIDEAIKNYAEIISLKRVAINAFTGKRREYDLPKLKHTKLLNK